VFGPIYEYFLAEFSKQGAHDNGEFFTSPSIVHREANVMQWTVLKPCLNLPFKQFFFFAVLDPLVFAVSCFVCWFGELGKTVGSNTEGRMPCSSNPLLGRMGAYRCAVTTVTKCRYTAQEHRGARGPPPAGGQPDARQRLRVDRRLAQKEMAPRWSGDDSGAR
jgi:hypothetical protein